MILKKKTVILKIFIFIEQQHSDSNNCKTLLLFWYWHVSPTCCRHQNNKASHNYWNIVVQWKWKL